MKGDGYREKEREWRDGRGGEFTCKSWLTAFSTFTRSQKGNTKD